MAVLYKQYRAILRDFVGTRVWTNYFEFTRDGFRNE